jgi:hypothetical protein
MSEPSYIGYLHTDDGVCIVGPDGFPDTAAHMPELADDETPALGVPTIDVSPESVIDTETGPPNKAPACTVRSRSQCRGVAEGG